MARRLAAGDANAVKGEGAAATLDQTATNQTIRMAAMVLVAIEKKSTG